VVVTFADRGVSSLVAIIATGDEKLILKIPLSLRSLSFSEGEAQFLRVWEGVGVRVPHVIEDGVLGDHSYTLMEYIDAPRLGENESRKVLAERGVYLEMGRILRKMHEPRAVGYGRIIQGQAEHATFEGWLEGADIQKRISYVYENKLLNDDHGSVEQVSKILLEHTEKENHSSYCHNDFGASNIFATQPLTIFDPNPRFNNGYLDLGQCLMKEIAHGDDYREAVSQLIDGYFSGGAYNEKVLHASIFLNAVIKLPYKHKTGKTEVIDGIGAYLKNNSHWFAA
jgi:fructosamine-3-kinase